MLVGDVVDQLLMFMILKLRHPHLLYKEDHDYYYIIAQVIRSLFYTIINIIPNTTIMFSDKLSQ